MANETKKETKVKKKKSNTLNFITILFAFVMVAYIVRYFMFKIDYEMVRYDTVESAVATQGILIKSEWTVALPGETEADYKANEGDRIATGKPILKISKNSGTDENISLKIAKINERIEEIQRTDQDNNFFAQDKQKLAANIDSNVKQLKSIAASGDLAKLETVKNELAANVYKNSLINGSDSFTGQYLEKLIQEKKTLEEIQRNNLNVIYARTSGVVSYELDGYEEMLKPENIKTLKASNIQSVLEGLTGKSKKGKEKDKIEKSEGVKVVDNFEWYIAAIVPANTVNEEQIGKTFKVRFSDINNTLVSGTLVRYDAGNEKGSLVVIKTDEQLKDFQRIRLSNIEIITKRSEGMIIPDRCLVEKDGLKGVYIDRSGMVKFVPVKILLHSGKEILVENLSKDDNGYDSKNYRLVPYDRVILSVNKIKEDQILPGAF